MSFAGMSSRTHGLAVVAGLVWLGAAGAADAPTPVDVTVGTSPISVAVDSATDRVYVANSDSFLSRPGTVSVIDGHTTIAGKPNTGKVIATIGVGRNPWGIAVDQKTDMVYVSNRGSNSVSVINGRTNKVVATVGVGLRPIGVGVVQADDTIYVANAGNGKAPGSVSVISGRSNKAVGHVDVGYSPFAIGVNDASRSVYVGNQGGAGPSTNYAGTVSVIRGTNAIATVAIGGSPNGIGVDSSTGAVYVANSSEDEGSTVAVLNGAGKLVARIAVQNQFGLGVSVDPAIHGVFVADTYSGSATGPVGTLTVINARTNGEIAEISVGGNPWGVAVDTRTSRVYMANDTSPGAIAMLDFKKYPILGGTPPVKITKPIETPTVPTTTTTTTTTKSGTPAPNTTLPPTNNKLAYCDQLDKAGYATVSVYPRLPFARSAVNPAGVDGCTESMALQLIAFERTPDKYTWTGSKPKVPTGLGAGAQFWINGQPNNRGLYVTFRVGGTWVGVTDNFFGAADPKTEAAGFLTMARQLYTVLGG